MPSASATRPSMSRPRRLPVAGGDLDHARGQVGDRAAARHPGLDQVEQEEAGAAAEFQGPVVGQLAQLVLGHDGVEPATRVVDAALVVGDRPLVVVGLGLPVVVEHLGELGVVPGGLDLLGGRVRYRSRVAGDIGNSSRGGDILHVRHEGSLTPRVRPQKPRRNAAPGARRRDGRRSAPSPRPARPVTRRGSGRPRPAPRRTRRRGPPTRRPGAVPAPPPARRTGR